MDSSFYIRSSEFNSFPLEIRIQIFVCRIKVIKFLFCCHNVHSNERSSCKFFFFFRNFINCVEVRPRKIAFSGLPPPTGLKLIKYVESQACTSCMKWCEVTQKIVLLKSSNAINKKLPRTKPQECSKE